MAIDTGDTAFLFASTALVMLMTVGLAFFYGGLVRRKNVLSIMMQSFAAFGVVTLAWVVLGYSLAFGTDHMGVIGGFDFVGLRGVGMAPHPVYAPTVPHLLFFSFQLMFAVITPALITGAFADRMRFSRWLAFCGLWLLLIYAPLAHWVWGGGFLAQRGVEDFAGGLVVHVSAGFGALASVFVFRPRHVHEGEHTDPHNVPYVLLGAGLLWFGWFGFNAGSALAANGIAANAFVTTMLGGAFGLLGWMGVNWWRDGKPTVSGAVTGSVAGLATITPASGFVAPWASIVIGLAAGVVCYFATKFRTKRGWDDALDVWGCHGIGGLLGIVATGVFASAAINGAPGLVEGQGALLVAQLGAAAFVAAFSFAGTYALLRVLQVAGPLQVAGEEERHGLDKSEHGEAAYTG